MFKTAIKREYDNFSDLNNKIIKSNNLNEIITLNDDFETKLGFFKTTYSQNKKYNEYIEKINLFDLHYKILSKIL
jgi:hypothetical protein